MEDITTFVIDNKAYTVSPVTLGDLRQFRIWVQYLDWINFQDLKGTMPDEAFHEESRRIREECTRKHLNEGALEVSDLLDQVQGVCKLVELSLRHKHPDTTYQHVCNLLQKKESVALVEKVLILSGLAGDGAPKKKKINPQHPKR
jgi:hypothetical protein